ncbi:transposase [Actinacidiphila glaucinigra]|uniref:transposase n=1 Tax=Actinacidiphila glaucinigra TaxID=235986 RepID=UPI0037186F70
MTPHTARTWSRIGVTPVIRVNGGSRRHLSVAALCCYKPGQRPRLVFRHTGDRRADGRKGFSWKDLRDLLTATHTQLGGPIVLVWDNVGLHLSRAMRAWTAARAWLTVFQLPACAPDLNPMEGIGSSLRRTSLADIAFTDYTHLLTAVRRGLRQIQYRPTIITSLATSPGDITH